MNDPHRFWLVRDVDHAGISGIGRVAQGVQFADGTCTMRWMTAHHSTCVYASMVDLVAIHGHHGDSHIEWIDL